MSVYIWKKESKERIILVVSLLFSCPVMADSVCVCVWRWQFFYFLFCKCVYFNWRLIIYNIVVVFAIYLHEPGMSVHVSPILNPPPTSFPIPPLRSSQCTSPEPPVSCIKPGMTICFTYDNIHVSVLFSQIIPPSPSPTESRRLLYTSVSPLLSHMASSLPSF